MAKFPRIDLRLPLAGLLASAVVVVGASGVLAAGSETMHGIPHYQRLYNGHHSGPTVSNPLYSHGGTVETAAAVYISYWGSAWSTGFSTGGYSSSSAQSYLSTFFQNVGGSAWANSTTQYCQGVASGTSTCPGGAARPTNPVGELKGSWVDTTAVPSTPTQSDIMLAAERAESHFGYNASATYFVLTPTGHSMSGFGTSWCAWHSATTISAGQLAYAYLPYQPDAGKSCGMNFVNSKNNAFGNGYFDGFSIVGGHEYAEAITDPSAAGGWLDTNSLENGDKCAWSSASANVTLGSNAFAVQPLWSNASGGCALSY